MSTLEQDAFLDVCIGDELDNERRRAAAEDGNDNDTIYPEEMTDEQRMGLRVDNLRAAQTQTLRLLNFLTMVRDGMPVGARFAPAICEAEIQRARDVIGILDRTLELEGE